MFDELPGGAADHKGEGEGGDRRVVQSGVQTGIAGRSLVETAFFFDT
jgi:hypothetical protein